MQIIHWSHTHMKCINYTVQTPGMAKPGKKKKKYLKSNKKTNILPRRKKNHGNHFFYTIMCKNTSTNTLGKGMNPIILPPAMGK